MCKKRFEPNHYYVTGLALNWFHSGSILVFAHPKPQITQIAYFPLFSLFYCILDLNTNTTIYLKHKLNYIILVYYYILDIYQGKRNNRYHIINC